MLQVVSYEGTGASIGRLLTEKRQKEQALNLGFITDNWIPDHHE